MIVDDDLDSRELLEHLLADRFETVSASNGQEALEHLLAAQRLPDVILLDLMMPTMDGYTFRERQLGYGKLSRIPVIIVSASVYNHRHYDYLECIMKPFNASDLVERIWERIINKDL